MSEVLNAFVSPQYNDYDALLAFTTCSNYGSFQKYQKQLQYASNYPKKVKKRKNICIWDYDDTLFPTHAFMTHQYKTDKQFMSKLVLLVSLINQIFIKTIELFGASNVIIITNGTDDWVDKSLNMATVKNTFMPFQKLLKKHNIKIISAATSEMKTKYADNYYKWKQIAFSKCFQKYFDNKDDIVNSITSIGDSLYEYKASNKSSKYLKHRILNRVLLKSEPSVNEMIFQLTEMLIVINEFVINSNDIEMDYSSLKL
eukprot:288218_1